MHRLSSHAPPPVCDLVARMSGQSAPHMLINDPTTLAGHFGKDATVSSDVSSFSGDRPHIDNEMALGTTKERQLIMTVDNLKNIGAGHDSINVKLFKLSCGIIFNFILHLFKICLEKVKVYIQL